jgi:hypothetical protein
MMATVMMVGSPDMTARLYIRQLSVFKQVVLGTVDSPRHLIDLLDAVIARMVSTIGAMSVDESYLQDMLRAWQYAYQHYQQARPVDVPHPLSISVRQNLIDLRKTLWIVARPLPFSDEKLFIASLIAHISNLLDRMEATQFDLAYIWHGSDYTPLAGLRQLPPTLTATAVFGERNA